MPAEGAVVSPPTNWEAGMAPGQDVGGSGGVNSGGRSPAGSGSALQGGPDQQQLDVMYSEHIEVRMSLFNVVHHYSPQGAGDRLCLW